MGLSLDAIRTDGGTQPRGALDADHVARLVESLAAGAALPPVVVFYDGADHWLADGFHRVSAHRAAGALEIAAEVRQGTRRDAVLYSVGANATHGLPRSNADKRRAVETLLRDEEWARWSDREIARRAGVSQPFVSSLRATIDSGFQSSDTRLERRGEKVIERDVSANRSRTETPAAEIPSDSEVCGTVAQTPAAPNAQAPHGGAPYGAPTPTEVRFEIEPDDDDGPLTPLEYEPEPVDPIKNDIDPAAYADVPVDELVDVARFVGQAAELRNLIEAFVTAHPYDSIRSPRMRKSYEDAFIHLVRVIVGRLPEPLRAQWFDAPAAPSRPKFTVIQGGTR